MSIEFSKTAWEEYLDWQKQDKKTLKRINQLINEIIRTPCSGSGKPEPLQHELSGFWSRRIDRTNRIVYRVSNEAVQIVQVKYHY